MADSNFKPSSSMARISADVDDAGGNATRDVRRSAEQVAEGVRAELLRKKGLADLLKPTIREVADAS